VCTIAVLCVTGRHALVIAAGHRPPLPLRDGHITAAGTPGVMLGAVDHPRIVPESVQLAADDRLLLYTDGVTDAVGSHDRFGEQRLLQAVAELARRGPNANLATGLPAAIDAFAAGDQADDIAIVALRDRQRASRPLAA
jgi:sigma-B regulation protein RsbU (phosphoserine phosphatase)